MTRGRRSRSGARHFAPPGLPALRAFPALRTASATVAAPSKREKSRSAPLVSILLPVRDAEATLEQAVNSIRSQTLEDWEMIVVDDGSTDRSPRILRLFADADSRIRIHTQASLGLVSALEVARAEARAPLLARMDADDRAHPERLAAQVRLLDEEPEIVLVGTHVRYFPRPRLKDGARRYEAWLNSLKSSDDLDRDMWVECPLAHPTFMGRASAIAAVGGYQDHGWPEDYDLLIRLRTAGGRLGVVPRVLHEWRESSDRLSRTDLRYSPDAFRRIKARYLARTLLRNRNGLLIWGAGPVGKSFSRAARREGVEIRAFVELNPRKVGQTIHGVPVVPPERINEFRGAVGVAAVGKGDARDEIRLEFARMGWVEGTDFVAVA